MLVHTIKNDTLLTASGGGVGAEGAVTAGCGAFLWSKGATWAGHANGGAFLAVPPLLAAGLGNGGKGERHGSLPPKQPGSGPAGRCMHEGGPMHRSGTAMQQIVTHAQLPVPQSAGAHHVFGVALPARLVYWPAGTSLQLSPARADVFSGRLTEDSKGA